MAEEFKTNSCIRGYHVYQERWVPVIGERLECKRESGNPRDRYAVAVCKGDEIVGHVPRYISTLCSLFIRHGGIVYSIVLEGRRPSPRQDRDPLQTSLCREWRRVEEGKKFL